MMNPFYKMLVGMFALGSISLQHFVSAQGEHEGQEHQEGCPPENPNCHIPTFYPTGVPTSQPSTNFPTFVYTIDFADTVETKIWPEDGTEMDYYGYSTAIHHRTAVVGAYGTKDEGEDSGSVYVYSTNATSFPYYDNGTTPWEFQQKLVYEKWEQRCNKDGCTYVKDDHAAENSQFGFAVSVWNNTIVVGAHRHQEHHAAGGGAYVYSRSSYNGKWTLMQALTPEEGQEYHYFGFACSIYDTEIILGASGDDHGGVSSGAAYIYEYDESYSAWFEVAKLTSSNAQAFDNFGSAVDIYKRFAVIGASGDQTLGTGAGAAFVFIKLGTWIQEMKLTAFDGGAKHYFGQSVAIYEETIVVGAYQGHGHWDYSGCAYVYTVDNYGVWNLQSKLIAHDGMSDDKFAWTVAIYKDTIVIGAYGEQGKQHEEEHHHKRALQAGGPQDNNNQNHEHGENCGPNSPPDCQQYQGSYSYRGASSGSVYVFARSGTAWLQEFKLIANGTQEYDAFGKSVAIHENVLFVGADMSDGIVQNSGAAYIYAPPTMSPSTNSDTKSKGFYMTGSAQADTMIGILFVLVPVVIGAAWYYMNQNKKDTRQQHLPVSTDSQHGSSAPWSMHGAIDDSSRSGGRPTVTRSPLRGPPVARGL